MKLLDLVRETIRRHELARADTRVLLAVSGGSDSVALAALAGELAAAGELRIAGIAHFNHQLRETAARDEQFCQELADRFGWPIQSGRGDVAGRAAREGRSIEDAARTSRHEFLEEARGFFDADVVALGHTRDDQAETFLLRLLRGAGARGLAAMHPRNGRVVRPLLACRRADLRAYLADRGLPFVDDETNLDVSIARNRVRAELLPLLESRFNPNIVETLAAEADLARDEWQWMADASARLRARASHPTKAGTSRRVTFDIDALQRAPLALRRLAVWEVMHDIGGGRTVSFEHVESALRLADGRGGAFDAPGVRLQRDAGSLVLTGRPAGTTGRWSHSNLFEYPLSIPGEVALPEAGCVLTAAVSDESERGAGEILGRNDVALVRGDLCAPPLSVRNRRPGDRFCPDEVGRRRRLGDFFVDRKVTRARRDFVPIVVDAEGRIVWVAGYAAEAALRVTDPSQGVIILRLRQLGGPA
jgi:tRNA(Ile)-lysidine synthase